MRRLAISIVVMLALFVGCEGQTDTRVFVLNSSGVLTVGYNSCRGHVAIRALSISDESNPNTSRTLWHVVLASGNGTGRISLGQVPVGYRETISYDAAAFRAARHVAVDIVAADGYEGGMAGDLESIPKGSLLWSKGLRKGDDLDGISKSTFGC